MNQIELFNAVRKELMSSLPDGVSVHAVNLKKKDGSTYRAIAFRKDGAELCPLICMEPYFRLAEAGCTLGQIAEEIRSFFLQGSFRQDESELFFRFSEASPRIAFRLTRREVMDAGPLRFPHREFLDLYLTYYLSFPQANGKRRIYPVCEDHLRAWGILEPQLYRAAMAGMPSLLPPVCTPIEELLSNVIAGENGGRHPAPELQVLSCRDGFYGAAVILYPGFLRTVSDGIGGDLFLLPSSVHEFLALPVSSGITAAACADIVQSVNRTAVEEEDVLSDHVYRYLRSLDRIVLVR